MNYIYDILLNFQKEYYEFYEWNKNDEIYHMRKIPIIKINDKQFEEIKNNKIKFSTSSLKYFSNKAEKFNKNNIIKIKYIAVFANNNETIAIKLNQNGYITHKSSLILEEQEEVLEILKFTNSITLNYQIIEKKKKEAFKTRFEIENEKFIIKEQNKIYKENNLNKLNYLYLECFNKTENNINIAYKKLKKEIYQANSNFHKIYNILKKSKTKQK